MNQDYQCMEATSEMVTEILIIFILILLKYKYRL